MESILSRARVRARASVQFPSVKPDLPLEDRQWQSALMKEIIQSVGIGQILRLGGHVIFLCKQKRAQNLNGVLWFMRSWILILCLVMCMNALLVVMSLHL